MKTPVLFLVFNRPDTTARVFESIRAARPERLYVAADGPRLERLGEAERCHQVRRITTDVDWPCELHTLFRDGNLGCRRAVRQAISWFFEQEHEGIILEDDCLPDASFFPYCTELLEKWRNEKSVLAVSGRNQISSSGGVCDSYFWSAYPHIWGWATWRRSWQNYDDELASFDIESAYRKINQHLQSRPAAKHWVALFRDMKSGHIHGSSWGYRWMWTCFNQGGLIAVPKVNLVRNIGFGLDATHTTAENHREKRRSVGRFLFPVEHAPQITRRSRYDDKVFNRVHRDQRVPILRRLARSLRKRINSAVGNLSR